MSKKTNYGTEHENLHELLECEYIETDIPEMIIRESDTIRKFVELVITELDPYLKKSFTGQVKKIVITNLAENYETVEILREVTDNLLHRIIRNDGQLEIKEPEEEITIHPMWTFRK